MVAVVVDIVGAVLGRAGADGGSVALLVGAVGGTVEVLVNTAVAALRRNANFHGSAVRVGTVDEAINVAVLAIVTDGLGALDIGEAIGVGAVDVGGSGLQPGPRSGP